jgi:hypothetical protein
LFAFSAPSTSSLSFVNKHLSLSFFSPFPTTTFFIVFLRHLSRMASNTGFTHRRSSSAVSSADEVTSNDGTLSGPASTVPTARSTPFIGPQNHPGIPAQYHPAVPALALNDNDGSGNHPPLDAAFASQLAGIETQIRLLDSIGSGYG